MLIEMIRGATPWGVATKERVQTAEVMVHLQRGVAAAVIVF
jgi:hypothetical protein